MKIALVRHGETDYNKQGRLQGVLNIPLNDHGRKQAHDLRKRIEDIKFDICFSSPFIRAMETAMILVGDKTEIIRDDRLKERNLGNLEGKDKSYYHPHKYWDDKLNSSDENVEKVQDLFQRCQSFLDYIKEKYPNQNILIVTHGATLRALHHLLYHTDLNKNLLNFKIDNCFYEEIEI